MTLSAGQAGPLAAVAGTDACVLSQKLNDPSP